MSGRGVISKDEETMLDTTKVLDQLRTELHQLRSCQQELELLKEKLVADEIWKKTIENFLSCHLGFDVQRAMKEPSSSPSSRQTAFDKSPTVGDIVSGRYQYRRSPSTTSTGGLGSVGSSNVYTSSTETSNSKSDSAAIPIYSSHLPGSLNLASQMDSKNRSLHRLGNKVFTTTLSNTTRSNKYSSSYSEAVIDQDAGSSALTGKRKLSSDDLIWSSTPTFPLSDTIAHCAGDSSPNDNDQDTEESDSRRDSIEVTEVKFQEIEDKIREVVPVGSRKAMYECTICGKSLTQRQNARLHVRRVHFLERLKCTACGRGFYDRRCVSNHKAVCPKYAEMRKNKELSSLSLSDNNAISTYHNPNQLRTSSSLSDDSPLVDDSENDQDISAGNSWMEKSRSSPSADSETLIKDEDGLRHPVTFIISNNNGDDNLSMRKESDQHSNSTTNSTRKARRENDEEGEDPSGDGSPSDNLFYGPGKSLVVVEIVPEMFHFEDTNT